MIRKGQVRWVSGSDVRRQIQFIKNIFEVVAYDPKIPLSRCAVMPVF